ncbi:putative signaling protein [Paraglaciecola mesophila]|uniref:Putative signaling protein n=2 Tax=Paraglaciecola mesophila TaxID=197222 RepID=A0A857JPJ4_9ALTE|nr:putative signaling protein [Paraglaciecola mesophila]
MRMSFIFLLLLTIIVLVTLYFVQRATYQHSSIQLFSHMQTSVSVVRDNIEGRASALDNGMTTLAKDFSIKQLIATANDDRQSLKSAMFNYQNRLGADIFWVLADDFSPLVSTSDPLERSNEIVPSFTTPELHWFSFNHRYYLLRATPVRFVENSTQVNAWVVMGIDVEKLFTQNLVELTNMQMTLLSLKSNTLLGATPDTPFVNSLVLPDIEVSSGLHRISLSSTNTIYTTVEFGVWEHSPVYIVASTGEDDAYLSSESLIGQLFIILLSAATLGLLGATLLSREITKPLHQLIKAAHRMRAGEFVETFPSANTLEVESLSSAFDEMQQGIRDREEQIHHLAYYDELTNIPNRIQFSNHIRDILKQQPECQLTVLMLDVDRFKDINDTLGHDLGDELLIAIARRLSSYATESSFCARLGGDEYAVVSHQGAHDSPEEAAEQLIKLFEQPFKIENVVLDVDCSVGIALYPQHAQSLQGLMQCADIAMYSCKDQHNAFAVYTDALNKHSVVRLSLMSELKGALAEGQLELHYQPKLTIHSHKVETLECLIRWFHPEHGFVPPDDFIPLAEQTGSIRHVTQWALRTACQQVKKWQEQDMHFTVAVNISAIDLVDLSLPDSIASLLMEFDLLPSALTMEVTESAVMSDPQNALRALNLLRNMGITLSIDDFGTGYSSMAQLKKMPVDELKIDKAFVLDLATNQDDRVMVKTLVSLAQNLGLTTVAEGVEDLATLEFLTEIGCTKAQGYYMTKALRSDELVTWYQNFTRNGLTS